MSYHFLEGVDSRHPAINKEYNTEALMLAATGFASTDLGSLAWVKEDNSIWMLVSTSPQWVKIGPLVDFKGRFVFEDDFLDRRLNDEKWEVSYDAPDGTVELVDGDVNGVLELETGVGFAAACYLDGVIHNLRMSQNLLVTFVAKLNQTSDINVTMALYKDSNEYAQFLFGSGFTKWRCVNQGGGGETSTDTDDIDTDYHVFQIRTTNSSIDYLIDGVVVATHTTNLPSSSILRRRVQIHTVNPSAAKSMKLDLVRIEGDRI